jgi:TRAP-type C4-dicarboxylate transport system permease small subunit
MTRGKRKVLIYFMVSFFGTVILRAITDSPIWGLEMLKQWLIVFLISLGIDSAWENIGR